MKILLIDPPEIFLQGQGHTRQVQPLGLGYVGAVLSSDYDVRLLLPDTRAYVGDDPWGELDAVIASEAPDVVGLTAVTATYPAAATLALRIRALMPDVTIVLGGVHASAEPVAALRDAAGVDYVVQGEGEETLRALLRGLEARARGDRFEPGEVAGLVWRDACGEPRRSPARPPVAELDTLPFPLREGLVWAEDVHPAFYQGLITLRGCPYRCIYCAVPLSATRQTRYRSAENVVAEIALLKERYDASYLFFHDSVFTLHRRRTMELCSLMVARGLVTPFGCQVRADRLDEGLLEALAAAGCEHLFFGIESGDEQTLARLRKPMTLATIRSAVSAAKQAGMRCTGYFMVGFPWETEGLVRKTMDFASELDLDAISLFSATPLPGTELELMTGSAHQVGGLDFRTPAVNLTHMSLGRYERVFSEAKLRVEKYNQSRMMASVANLAPSGAA